MVGCSENLYQRRQLIAVGKVGPGLQVLEREKEKSDGRID